MKMSTILASLALLLVACNPMEQQAVLSAPSDVKVEQTGLETVRLTWTNSSTSYDGVIIERASQASGLQFAELTRTGKGVLIYNDKNHDGDASYRYRLTTYLGSDMSEPVVVDFLYSRLPAPTEIVCEKTSEGLVITWKDNCTGEEGYIVRKKEGSGSFADWKVLPANSTTVTDPEVSSGSYDYELYAYVGEERSAAATIHYEDFSVPQITIGNKQASWYQVNIPFTLKDDGGYTCEAGICWRRMAPRELCSLIMYTHSVARFIPVTSTSAMPQALSMERHTASGHGSGMGTRSSIMLKWRPRFLMSLRLLQPSGQR